MSEFTLATAIELAAKYHAGQKRLGGDPFILHPIRVMLAMETEEERIVAVLHDIIEDTQCTECDLAQANISGVSRIAIMRLTKQNNETYADYLKQLKIDPLARAVKIADLKDNLDVKSLSHHLGEKDHRRLTKHMSALLYMQTDEEYK